MNNGKVDTAPKPKPRGTRPMYQVAAGLDGDIFPVFANYASLQSPRDRQVGTVTVTVANASDSLLRQRIAVQVPGWSDQEIQIVEVGAGQVRKLQFAPSFLPRLYRNREITAATARVTVTDTGGNLVWTTTVPVRMRSAEDMYWGANFQYASFIASWVTPHDPRVEAVLAKAKEYVPGRRLAGYESGKPFAVQQRWTTAQARAIYRALQELGVSYVKSSGTFGAKANSGVTERVRLPYESLARISANCIDGAVLYASLFENLGMETEVVIVPGHAFIGVRLADNSDQYLYLETALTGRASFATAVQAARRGMIKYSQVRVVRVPINDARQAGIFPMPNPRASEPVETSGLK
jgi:hypothetical protein